MEHGEVVGAVQERDAGLGRRQRVPHGARVGDGAGDGLADGKAGFGLGQGVLALLDEVLDVEHGPHDRAIGDRTPSLAVSVLPRSAGGAIVSPPCAT
jgi:hypothetical protein